MNKDIVEAIVGGLIMVLLIEGFFSPIQGIIEAWRRKK